MAAEITPIVLAVADTPHPGVGTALLAAVVADIPLPALAAEAAVTTAVVAVDRMEAGAGAVRTAVAADTINRPSREWKTFHRTGHEDRGNKQGDRRP